MDNDYVFLIVY